PASSASMRRGTTHSNAYASRTRTKRRNYVRQRKSSAASRARFTRELHAQANSGVREHLFLVMQRQLRARRGFRAADHACVDAEGFRGGDDFRGLLRIAIHFHAMAHVEDLVHLLPRSA